MAKTLKDLQFKVLIEQDEDGVFVACYSLHVKKSSVTQP